MDNNRVGDQDRHFKSGENIKPEKAKEFAIRELSVKRREVRQEKGVQYCCKGEAIMLAAFLLCVLIASAVSLILNTSS